jgi:hypothetical protein
VFIGNVFTGYYPATDVCPLLCFNPLSPKVKKKKTYKMQGYHKFVDNIPIVYSSHVTNAEHVLEEINHSHNQNSQ